MAAAAITTIQCDNNQQIFARMSNQMVNSQYNDHHNNNSNVKQPESTLFENIFIIGSYMLLVATFPISLLTCFKVDLMIVF